MGALARDVGGDVRPARHRVGVREVGGRRHDHRVEQRQPREALRLARARVHQAGPAEAVPDAERDRLLAALRDERRRERREVERELVPAVRLGRRGLVRVAVAARVEADHVEALAQPLGQHAEHVGAEAVRVGEQRERTVAAPVDERELDASLGKRQRAAAGSRSPESPRRQSRRSGRRLTRRRSELPESPRAPRRAQWRER